LAHVSKLDRSLCFCESAKLVWFGMALAQRHHVWTALKPSVVACSVRLQVLRTPRQRQQDCRRPVIAKRAFSAFAVSQPRRKQAPASAPSEDIEHPTTPYTSEAATTPEQVEAADQAAENATEAGPASTKGSAPHEDTVFDAGSSVWPFLSPIEEAAHVGADLENEILEGAKLKPLDAGLLAGAVAQLPEGPDRELALTALLKNGVARPLSQCSSGVLSGIITGLDAFPESEALRRQVAEELLQRVPLRVRHSMSLLAALETGMREGEKPLIPIGKALASCGQALSAESSERLTSDDAVASLVSLAFLRGSHLEPSADELSASLAVHFLARLGGGRTLCRLLLQGSYHNRHLAQRALAALWTLPEALSRSDVAFWTSSLKSIKRPPEWLIRQKYATLDEATVASAACTLARCGAWQSARCDHLLHQALMQGSPTPGAGALWLCAIAQAGVELESAALHLDCSEHLLPCAQAIASEDQPCHIALGRTLWSLSALGQSEAEGIGEVLLKRLAEADASQFTAETWAMLREVQVLLGRSEAVGDDEDAGDDAQAGDALGPFGDELWKQCLTKAGELEAKHFVASRRFDDLKAALAVAEAEASKAAVSTEEGEADKSESKTFSDIELQGCSYGPFGVSFRVGSHGMALDFDVHQTPMSRALRRQLWTKLAPDVRVAEITLAQWDGLDADGRAALVNRRVLDIPDPVEEEEEED